MTITKYDKFAIVPTRCWTCNRLFIFEWYNYAEMDIAPCCPPLRKKYCKECLNNKKTNKEK